MVKLVNEIRSPPPKRTSLYLSKFTNFHFVNCTVQVAVAMSKTKKVLGMVLGTKKC